MIAGGVERRSVRRDPPLELRARRATREVALCERRGAEREVQVRVDDRRPEPAAAEIDDDPVA